LCYFLSQVCFGNGHAPPSRNAPEFHNHLDFAFGSRKRELGIRTVFSKSRDSGTFRVADIQKRPESGGTSEV
jgi:hypothetical protein